MKSGFRIISVAITLSLLLALVVVAPLGAVEPETEAPEPVLLWSYSTTYSVTDIATGDLNGDGKDDVVAIEIETRTLSAISGADGSPLWDDDSISGYAVAIGDITGDGQNEVIAGGWDDDYGESEGAFGEPDKYVLNAYAADGILLWTHSTYDWVHDIEIGDVDGDGIDDVVACNDYLYPTIYAIDGDGNDLPGWPVALDGEVVDLAVGQLDGQAGVDVAAIGESEPATLYVYDSNGDELWSDHYISGRSVEIGDVDGDGVNEVVSSFYGHPPEPEGSGFGENGTPADAGWVLAFDGDEGGEPLYTFLAAEGKHITDIELGDLDGEPGVEIAAITGDNNDTLFAIDIDSDTEQKMWRYSMDWPNMFYGESLAIGDVDRDYKNEVVAASSAIYHAVYAFDGMDNNGDGDGDLVWAPYEVDFQITDLEIGDLDGDGDQDVAFGTRSPKTVYAIAKVEESFSSATGTGTVYIDSDPSTIGNPSSVDPATLPDEGKPDISFPHGLFSFNITGLDNGQTATVTITLPDPMPMNSEYWKYGPTPGNPTDHWYQIPMGDDDGDNVITFELVDGGLGDDDLITDGTIIDAGGPGYYLPVGGEAYPVGNSSSLPALWLSVAFALAWIVVSLLMLRRQQN